MNQQKFIGISASHKNILVKFAKRNGYRFNTEKSGRRLFNVIVYCSSEAMEDRRF
jgi:hypothetical protein